MIRNTICAVSALLSLSVMTLPASAAEDFGQGGSLSGSKAVSNCLCGASNILYDPISWILQRIGDPIPYERVAPAGKIKRSDQYHGRRDPTGYPYENGH